MHRLERLPVELVDVVPLAARRDIFPVDVRVEPCPRAVEGHAQFVTLKHGGPGLPYTLRAPNPPHEWRLGDALLGLRGE